MPVPIDEMEADARRAFEWAVLDASEGPLRRALRRLWGRIP